jgi:predicted Zn-dependent peptidase
MVSSVRFSVAIGLITVLPFVASGAAAQNAGRIPFDTYTLPNGLQVVFSEDHSTPIVTVDIWYHVGSSNERPRRSGFAHLFEHMMFQGSAHVAKRGHTDLITRAGGTYNGSTTEDRTNYFQTVPSNNLARILWLEADRMRSLAVTQENFENQRQVVKEERRLRLDNVPYARIAQEAFSLPFDSTTCFAYAHTVIGDMADLDSARVEDVQAFFNQFYIPSNATLTVVGDFDPAEARRLIEQFYGDIPHGADAPRSACDTRYNAGARRVEATDRNANLPAVIIAYKAPAVSHADAPALGLLSTILGGGESSRLNLRVVRQERAALAGQAIANLRRGPGAFLVIGIANQGVGAARVESLLVSEVARLQSDSIAQAELAKAKNLYRAGAIRQRQTTFGVAETLQNALWISGSLEAANVDVDRYMAVTVDDLRRVARTYLVPDNALTVIVNPPAAGGAR